MPPSILRAALAALLLGAGVAAPLAAQQTAPAPAPPIADQRLRVFLDCQNAGCDRNFFVIELGFALWTQDRLDADVHLLITRLNTGAGGGEYTLTFIGQRRFAGRVDTLVTFLPPNSTDDMRRRELARMTTIGLAPLAVRLPGGERFAVRYTVPEGAEGPPAMTAFEDPWDFWVYRTRLNASGSAESRSSSYEVQGNVNASRVTEDWKVSFNAQNEYRFNRFETSDTTERRFVLRSVDASARLVKSLSDHWSVGARVNGGLSEFRNQDAFGAVDLSAEWNHFPWREATSRQLLVAAGVGSRYFRYREETIYGRLSEHRPVARVVIAGESRQQWGTVDASLRYTKFLHDGGIDNLGFFGRTNFRITRGLSLELRGEMARVNDQLYLARGDATEAEVLTRQRALATAFRLNGSVGLTFTFGSIYNSIVNPRLDDIGQ
jgi:hypothetical protein